MKEHELNMAKIDLTIIDLMKNDLIESDDIKTIIETIHTDITK